MPSLRLRHIALKENTAVSTIKSEISLQYSYIYSLDVEGWCRYRSRSDDLSTLDTGCSRSREVGVKHIEADADGLEDVEQINLLESNVEVIFRIRTECATDADASLGGS